MKLVYIEIFMVCSDLLVGAVHFCYSYENFAAAMLLLVIASNRRKQMKHKG